MKLSATNILWFLGLSLLLLGCKKEVTTIPDKHPFYTYFPLKTGNEYTYQADSEYYNSFKEKYEIHSYQIKIVIDTPFTDNAKQTAYKVLYYYRATPTQNWDSVKVNYWKKTNNEVVKVIENIRYRSLVFPVEESKTWDGNVYNHLDSFGQFSYSYKNVHQPFSINAFSFDSSVTVEQINQKDAVQQQYQDEKYVAGVGMVSKTVVDTSFLIYRNGIKVTKGGILNWKLIDYKIK